MTRKTLGWRLMGSLAFAMAGAASADTVTIDLVHDFTGGKPTGNTPWARAVFNGSGLAGDGKYHVSLTLKGTPGVNAGDGLQASEWIHEWDFNVKSGVDLSKLSGSIVSSPALGIPSIGISSNNYSLTTPSGKFDIELDFQSNNALGKFGMGDVVVLDFKSSDVITAGSFFGFSANADQTKFPGGLVSVAHVQSIDDHPDSSKVLGVGTASAPEAAPLPPMALGGAILIGGMGLSRLRGRRSARRS